MGVDRTDYVVYGWQLPAVIYDAENKEVDVWDEKFLPYVEGHKGVDYCLVRGEKYIVFGFCVASGGDKYEGWDFEPLNTSLPKPHEVQWEYCELFGYKTLPAPSLFIFTHWH
jgi:hypothetical protein